MVPFPRKQTKLKAKHKYGELLTTLEDLRNKMLDATLC